MSRTEDGGGGWTGFADAEVRKLTTRIRRGEQIRLNEPREMNIYMSVFATLAIASSCIYAFLWDPYPLMYSDIRTFLCYENFKRQEC